MANMPPAHATVIDAVPTKTRQYVGSPSLAKLPNGEWIASHDYFGPGTNFDTMSVFGSTDGGKTWEKRATFKGQWWSTLFLHDGALYLHGTTREYGHCVIRRSRDGGRTWTTPDRPAAGLLVSEHRCHCAPTPILVHQGRLWKGMEEFAGPRWGTFNPFMMSVPVDADLLDARAWTSSNRLPRDPQWLGGTFGAWLEGNAVAAPDGSVLDILRVERKVFPEHAAAVRISADGKRASFDAAQDFVEFPGGAKKFTIRRDPQGGRYWTLANHVPKEFLGKALPAKTRNTLALCSSAELRSWRVERIVLQHPDIAKHGFQYCDWVFDGPDLVAVVRAAFAEADGALPPNAHDANHLIFHRVPDFRTNPAPGA